MKVAHAGLAVSDLEDAKKLWQELGFSLEKEFEKPEPKAKVAVLRDEQGGRLELWGFEQSNHELTKIIGRHIAFECKDARTDAEKLKTHGFKEVIPFTEGVTLDYLFLEDVFGTYYELAQLKDAAIKPRWK